MEAIFYQIVLMSKKRIKELQKFYSGLPTNIQVEIIAKKQKYFQKKVKHYKNKSELDLACFVLAIDDYLKENYSEVNNYLNGMKVNVKKKEYGKKFKQLLFHKKLILSLKKNYSLRDLSKVLLKKTKIKVSHSYIGTFIKKIEEEIYYEF